MQREEANTSPPDGPSVERQSPPDLHSQLESLFDQVWHCEAAWRFEDRLDLAIRLENALTAKCRSREPGRAPL